MPTMTEIQTKFNTLTKEDFIEIAQSAADSVEDGKVKEKVLVNLSSPDVMIFDPVCLPREYKHLEVEYKDGTEILIMIGLD